MAEAVEVVRSKRQPDGRWVLERVHPGRVHFDLEGGVGAPSRWNTLRAAGARLVGPGPVTGCSRRCYTDVTRMRHHVIVFT